MRRLPCASAAFALVALVASSFGMVDHIQENFVGVWVSAPTPMFSRADAPWGTGDSTFDLELMLAVQDGAVSVELVAFPWSSRAFVGYGALSSREYCCTQSAVTSGLCAAEQEGLIAVSASAPHVLREVFPLSAANGSTFARLERSIGVTDVWTVLVADCSESGVSMSVEGRLVWRGPFGLILASLARLVPFTAWLTSASLLVALVWWALSAWHWRTLLPLQSHIGLVLALGFADALFRYLDLEQRNATGAIVPGLLVVSVLLAAARRTGARVLVLVLALGYGVVRPTLGDDLRKVQLVGALYFVFSAVQSLVFSLTTLHTGNVQVLLLAPSALLDSVFAWWTLFAIARCYHHLVSRNQSVKQRMYARFGTVLAVALAAAVVVSISQVIVVKTRGMRAWQSLWAFEVLWDLIMSAVTVAVAYIWRPASTSAAFAYEQPLDQQTHAMSSGELSGEDGEVQLGLLGASATRRAGVENSNERSDRSAMYEAPRGLAAAALAAVAFSLVDDDDAERNVVSKRS